jgi:plastocyanin
LKVQVGEEALKFTPEDIREPPGTLLEFSFFPKAHTVTQSSFDKPCQPLNDGFSSGFIPTNSSPSAATFEYTVHSNTPVWFYCAQTNGDHCQSGMVGSINA